MIVALEDVLLYEDDCPVRHMEKRGYSALSYRLDSEKSVFRYNGKTVKANTDDISFVPQNMEYSRTAKREKIIVFHFNIISGAGEDIKVFTDLDKKKYRALFMKALDLWNTKAQGYQYRATAVLYEILAEMTSDGLFIAGEFDNDVSSVIFEIERNFSNPDFKIESLNHMLYISESFMRRKFKKQTGVSPKKFLIKRRIQEAKMMIKSNYYSQEQISAKCGFSDVKYFRYAFKNETGKTISQYKKM